MYHGMEIDVKVFRICHTRRYSAIHVVTYPLSSTRARLELPAYDTFRLFKPTYWSSSMTPTRQPHNSTAFFNNLPNSSSILFIPYTPTLPYLMCHTAGRRLFPVECGSSWSNSSANCRLLSLPLHFPSVMTILLTRDPIQWKQPLDNQAAKWRRLASLSYDDAKFFPASTSTSVEIRQVKTSEGNVLDVPASRFEECLPPVSVFA